MYCHRKFRPLSKPRLGCPWKNGYAEHLIRTLKAEDVYLNDSEDITEARFSRVRHSIGMSPETPTFGVRVFDTYRI
jgi:hypothetical protein